MDYNRLLDFAVDFGYELSMAGAEIYRVEDSITRIFAAYGIRADVFAIPNNLTVSIVLPDGRAATQMRRIDYHGNDLDSVTRFSNLSRRICREKPSDVDVCRQWLEETKDSRKHYSLPVLLFGYFLTAFFFTMLFGGSLIDSAISGVSALIVGLVTYAFNALKANPFFNTLLAAIPLALVPYAANALGICPNPDAAVIGAVMVLIPGLLFTTAMRDIIYGDTNSGINRIFQVLLIAVGIAAGTAAGWKLACILWGAPVSAPLVTYHFFIQCIVAFFGGMGFCFLFNIHFMGLITCSLGSVITWCIFRLSLYCGTSEMAAYFLAAVTSSVYAETMARIRKRPAISFLVISLVILIPGSSLYYTIYNLLLDNKVAFVEMGTRTIAITGLMAAGVLLVATIMRMWTEWKAKKLT